MKTPQTITLDQLIDALKQIKKELPGHTDVFIERQEGNTTITYGIFKDDQVCHDDKHVLIEIR